VSAARRIIVGRLQTWMPFVGCAGFMAWVLMSADRVPTGDAPHLLAISERLTSMLREGQTLEFFEAWSGLVTPHPPAGFLIPVVWQTLRFGNAVPWLTALTGMALIWHGMGLLFRGEGRSPMGPWLGGLMLFSMSATWSFVAHMAWDVLAAGCVCACVAHLHASDGLRNKGHALVFGVFMGIGFVTKYTFPAFLVLPVVFAGVAVIRFRSFSGLSVAMMAFAVTAGPWLWTHGDSMWAYVVSSASASHSISDSPASSWSMRFSPGNLLFYPTVLRDMVGWPGVLLLAVAMVRAWHKPAGRWALWSVLGGGLVLVFAGETQARYLYPALPLLAVCLDVGIRPGFGSSMARFGLVCGLCVTLPALWGTTVVTISDVLAPPTRDQTHAVETLSAWGEWPQSAVAFRPVSNPRDEWRIDAALAAIAEEVGPGSQQIGMILPRDIRMASDSTYAWRAAQLGLAWDVASIVTGGPMGRPMVFVGPLKPQGLHISRRFKVAYAVHQKGIPPKLLTDMNGVVRWQQDLPVGMQGSVFRIPDASWKMPTGLMLQQDPIDG
jgi:4-amino-4-deoxy-L-arabinose transferase-like glycosyltransferase